MTKREMVTRPSLGAIEPVTLHSSMRMGASPNSSTASTASSAFNEKFQEVGVPLASRTGVTAPLIVALLSPQVSVEGAISTMSLSFR
jgi:hypothetical protein